MSLNRMRTKVNKVGWLLLGHVMDHGFFGYLLPTNINESTRIVSRFDLTHKLLLLDLSLPSVSLLQICALGWFCRGVRGYLIPWYYFYFYFSKTKYCHKFNLLSLHIRQICCFCMFFLPLDLSFSMTLFSLTPCSKWTSLFPFHALLHSMQSFFCGQCCIYIYIYILENININIWYVR